MQGRWGRGVVRELACKESRCDAAAASATDEEAMLDVSLDVPLDERPRFSPEEVSDAPSPADGGCLLCRFQNRDQAATLARTDAARKCSTGSAIRPTIVDDAFASLLSQARILSYPFGPGAQISFFQQESAFLFSGGHHLFEVVVAAPAARKRRPIEHWQPPLPPFRARWSRLDVAFNKDTSTFVPAADDAYES